MAEIDVVQKQNKPGKQMRDVPQIKSEIKGLKKMQGDFSELQHINEQLNENKNQIQTHLT